VSHRPLERFGAGGLATPLVPTLVVAPTLEFAVSGVRGAVLVVAPALSPLVPVDGAAMPESERMIEPELDCAAAAPEMASSAAAAAAKTVLFIRGLL
jgi:hypothetical protein